MAGEAKDRPPMGVEVGAAKPSLAPSHGTPSPTEGVEEVEDCMAVPRSVPRSLALFLSLQRQPKIGGGKGGEDKEQKSRLARACKAVSTSYGERRGSLGSKDTGCIDKRLRCNVHLSIGTTVRSEWCKGTREAKSQGGDKRGRIVTPGCKANECPLR